LFLRKGESMSDIVYNAIRKRVKVFFEFIDSELMIHPTQNDFWEYLNIRIPENPVPLTDIIFELVGKEIEITLLLKGEKKSINIPAIQRETEKDRNTYFDLELITCDRSDYPLIVIIEDRTRIFSYQQKLVQSRNETKLLQKQLAEKNKALEKLNTIIQRQNLDLEKRVRERTQELQSARIEIIRRLAQAAEYRDPETGSHIVRMSKTCVLLAREIGLSEKDCDLIYHGGSMHDLGKIAIPDAILLKPGPLSSKEWQIMKQHTIRGARLLSDNDTDLMITGRIIARSHHERWDGNGYPDGISGENIHIFARICALADVFDALVSDRPYKKAWPFERAISTIEEGSGTQFDPEIVKAFLDISDKAIKLQQDFKDKST